MIKHVDQFIVRELFQPFSVQLYSLTSVSCYTFAKWLLTTTIVVRLWGICLESAEGQPWIYIALGLVMTYLIAKIGKAAHDHNRQWLENPNFVPPNYYDSKVLAVFIRKLSLIFMTLNVIVMVCGLSTKLHASLVAYRLSELLLWTGLNFLACIPPPPGRQKLLRLVPNAV